LTESGEALSLGLPQSELATAHSAGAEIRAEIPGKVDAASEPHFGYNAAKRVLDLVIAISLLLLTLPVFLGVTLVLLLRGGHVFFGQRRLGLGAKEFTCWKFRSMVVDAEKQIDMVRNTADNLTQGPTFKNAADPRITGFGRILRQTSIDELPQLLNVLRGDMSIVGPRPLAVDENRYKPGQDRRLSVKPGLTCIWQVSGRSDITFDRWMELDVEYVETRSLGKDLGLILRTVPAVITRKGAM
jgi:lipopolysaccharide/colanic/teichoic acid biosynthesis glycosyltransferase